MKGIILAGGSARVRQADDLLSAVNAYAGRNTGGAGHLYSA